MSTMIIDKRPNTKPETGKGRPWKVIVLNDSINSFQGVAHALSQVLPGTSYEAGLRMAEKIDREGRCVVWTGMREHAELYWSELSEYGLTMAPLQQ